MKAALPRGKFALGPKQFKMSYAALLHALKKLEQSSDSFRQRQLTLANIGHALARVSDGSAEDL